MGPGSAQQLCTFVYYWRGVATALRLCGTGCFSGPLRVNSSSCALPAEPQPVFIAVYVLIVVGADLTEQAWLKPKLR